MTTENPQAVPQPTAGPPPPKVKTRYSNARIALNALGVLIFPILWILLLIGLARDDPNSQRTAKYVLVVYGIVLAAVVVANVAQ